MPAVTVKSAKAPLILALDLGTSSLRALVYDALGRAITGAETQLLYQLRTDSDGAAEVAAGPLVDLLEQCIDGALAGIADRAGEIAAVGISCFWHSLLGLDSNDEPVTPVFMWGDTRSGNDVVDLRREFNQRAILARTGCRFHSSYWPAKLRWLARTQPDLFARVACWCSFGEYVRLRFCSDPAISISMASGTGLFDIHRLEWDPEVLDIVHVIPDQLNRVVDRDQAADGLVSDYAKRWPALATIPWYPALGDGGCANVGSGAIGADRVALTVGTSGALRIVAPFDQLTIPDGLWAYRLDHERYVVGGSLSNGGNVLGWLAELFGLQITPVTLASLEGRPPDSHGLTLLPFLAGERAPTWNDAVTGVVAGLTLATDRGALLRAGLEAIAYRFALLYRRLAPLVADDHLLIANGGAILRSPIWLQVMADVLGQRLATLSPQEESAGRGAAVLALNAIGAIDDLRPHGELDPTAGHPIYEPDPDRFAIYQRGLARHLKLESLLYPHDTVWDDKEVQSMQSQGITVYGTATCEDTARSRALLDRLDVPYSYVDLDRDKAADAWVRQHNHGHRITPTIVLAGGGPILVEPSDEELEAALRSAGQI